MESVLWRRPAVWARFRLGSQADADLTAPLAFNQGFYNLFLAVSVLVGIVLVAVGATVAGATLVFAGAGSMAAAALVLLISSPDKAGSALKQGAVPALAVIVLAIGLAL
jgi:putative membrane protein